MEMEQMKKTTEQLPILSISQVGTNTVLSWPAFGMGFRLQSVTNLAASNNWASVGGTPSAIADRLYLTNGATASSSYFRLVFP